MKKTGVALVEIVVSMLILAVSALAVTATISMVNSKEHRSAGGSSLDLQAASFARETLEGLKNKVSANAGSTGAQLQDISYTAPCAAAAGQPCGAGTTYIPSGTPGANQVLNTALLLTGSDIGNHVGTRTYKVWDISSGTSTTGTDVAYKKVTVTVQWTD